jgi:hypothetical protein
MLFFDEDAASDDRNADRHWNYFDRVWLWDLDLSS